MKKNNILRTAFGLIIATMFSLNSFVNTGSYAKYVTTANGSATATIAKFDVKVNGTQIAATSVVTLTSTNWTAENSLKEYNLSDSEQVAHVKVLNGSIIAPGTAGKIVLQFTNPSDVGVRITFTNTASVAADAGIEFRQGSNGSWNTNINTVLAQFDMEPNTTSAVDKDVYWRWAFEKTGSGEPAAQDAKDTALGIASRDVSGGGGTSVSLPFSITATQID
jgi:hypothetical protein